MRNFAVGDVLLEINRYLRCSQWNLGRIVVVFPGPDGLVRVVDVQFDRGVFRRGINTLALLEPATAESIQSSTAAGEYGAAPA